MAEVSSTMDAIADVSKLSPSIDKSNTDQPVNNQNDQNDHVSQTNPTDHSNDVNTPIELEPNQADNLISSFPQLGDSAFVGVILPVALAISITDACVSRRVLCKRGKTHTSRLDY